MDAPSTSLLNAARSLAQSHHSRYDPSHDYRHIERVVLTSLSIARSLPSSPDLLVVELAALFHDLLDKKYLPPGTSMSAQDRLAKFWSEHLDAAALLHDDRKRLVERIIEHVSYSKEVKRIKEGAVTEWEKGCDELHCVQDADKLDAIGAFGIMRCAAYSAIANRPLYAPYRGVDSAIDHFHDKLFKLEGMMKTQRGKELAKRRTEMMREFVQEVEREWTEVHAEVGDRRGTVGSDP